jgi:YD repeat-containing protein
MQRGDLNGTKDGLVANSKTFAEDWSLDMTGNWSTYRQDEDGDGNWDLNQSRAHNGANEITEIAGSSSHVAHDRNGNMTKIPKPDDWSAHFDLTYDAWNRLVTIEDGEDLVAEYQYDARSFRVVKKTYDGGELGETRDFLFNRRWQCVEERVDASTGADRQFVWGRRYIDDLILRDRDTSEPVDGTLNERLYAMQDANWNVVATSLDSHSTGGA